MIVTTATVASNEIISNVGDFTNTNMIGTIGAFGNNSPPTGWLICEGQTLNSVSNTQYARLFSAIGVIYGGSGSSSFNIPDYRGNFLRSRANGSANDPGRAGRSNRGDGTGGDVVGTKQVDGCNNRIEWALGARNGGPYVHLQLNQGPVYSSQTAYASMTVNHFNGYRHTHNTSGGWGYHQMAMYGDFGNSGYEHSPENMYVMYCIKY